WVLMILFFVVPTVISLVLALCFEKFLEHDFVAKFMTTSGYFYTLGSLILVFILFNTFKVSDYKKSVASKDFLEKRAFEELSSSLKTILDCLEKNETKNLHSSCMTVKEIYESVRDFESDVDLKAYSIEIRDVFSVLNKYKLSTIGYNSDVQKLENMRESYKFDIVTKIDRLVRQLEQRSNSNER
ncbi:hypothetical protein, partial [Planococcus sp. ISL-110]|uniref:hypothetical protein n=1 Tax=Planococcus sp. ISL-110 TaxID=2819167 RepID=UPI001BEADC49